MTPEDDLDNLILLPLLPSTLRLSPNRPKEPILDRENPPEEMLSAAIEAVLFVHTEPITIETINKILGKPGIDAIYSSLRTLQKIYRDKGINLKEVARGWQFRTDPRFAKWLQPLHDGDVPKLSKAALETLSIVAYHQPSTKNEIDTLRGVDSGAVLRSLLEYNLIEIQGRKSGTGTAMVYGTTPHFLSLFNLRDLSDLPRMRDIQELQQFEEFSIERDTVKTNDTTDQ